MRKSRTLVPEETVAQILFAADRACCVCESYGVALQIHHIDEDPCNHSRDNLAALCLECHNKTQLHGGFGRHLSARQVTVFRDAWADRVAKRRAAADDRAMGDSPGNASISDPATTRPEVPSRTGFLEYVNAIPTIRRLAYSTSAVELAESTVEMIEAGWAVVDTLVAVLVRLARWYPRGHFGTDDAREYFSRVVAERASWHRSVHSVCGIGWSGTIVGPQTAMSVALDVEGMIIDIVRAQLPYEDAEFSYEEWIGRFTETVP